MTAYDYCPSMGLACSTAALTHGCRCRVCGPWYEGHKERRRGGRPAKVVHAESPSCPVHGCKASSAYRKHTCRCEVCRGWNAARERRRRASLRTQKLEELWANFMAAFMADDELLVHMMEVSAKVAKTRARRVQR